MQLLTKNKGILAAVALFILAMFLYNLFFKPEPSVDSGVSATVIGDDLLKIRDQLEKVTLDRTIFSSAAYLLLNDFSIVITEQVRGRSNPFDLIGRD